MELNSDFWFLNIIRWKHKTTNKPSSVRLGTLSWVVFPMRHLFLWNTFDSKEETGCPCSWQPNKLLQEAFSVITGSHGVKIVGIKHHYRTEVMHAVSHLFIFRLLRKKKIKEIIYCDWSLASGKSNKDTRMEGMPVDYKITCTHSLMLLFLCTFVIAHNFITVVGWNSVFEGPANFFWSLLMIVRSLMTAGFTLLIMKCNKYVTVLKLMLSFKHHICACKDH